MVICQEMNQKKKEIRNLTSSFYRFGAIYDLNVPFTDRRERKKKIKSRTRKNFYFAGWRWHIGRFGLNVWKLWVAITEGFQSRQQGA